MTLLELYNFFNQTKKGDSVEIVLNNKSFYGRKFEGKPVEGIMNRKECEIGEYDRYHGKTYWTKPIKREEYFDKYYDKDTNYRVHMYFSVNTDHGIVPIYASDIESIKILIPNKAWSYVERAYDWCNQQEDDVDIYEGIYKYKVLRELSKEQIENVYDYLSDRLGFTN